MAKKKAAAKKAAPPPKRLILGDKEFAVHYAVSTRTVQTWRDKGLPATKVGHQYEYDLDETDQWVDEFRAEDDSTESSEVRRQREVVKLKIEQEQLEKIARENKEAQGNILPKDEFELHLVERNQLVRDSFLNMSKQMRKHLCPKCIKKLPELDKLIDKALNQLADRGQEE